SSLLTNSWFKMFKPFHRCAPFKAFKPLGRIRNRFERLERFERIEPGSNIDQQARPQQGYDRRPRREPWQTWTIPPCLDSHRKQELGRHGRPAIRDCVAIPFMVREPHHERNW